MRFWRSPKGLMIVVLGVLLLAAALGPDRPRVWTGILVAALGGSLVDAVWLRARHGRWEWPSGALLTALFVAMVLSPFEAWWVPLAVTALGVASKYLARTRSANVFNPAALGLVVSYYVFETGQSWWGALPESSWWGALMLLATGAFITDRVNKMPLVLVFLGTYFGLFTVTAFFGDPKPVVEIFREPDINAAIFFACFILTDPPTSPVKYRDQIICGLIVAVAAWTIFEVAGAVHYLLSAVLVGNLWEAWRRAHAHRQRARARAHAAASATKPESRESYAFFLPVNIR